jgi:cyclohexa-1,5-dienecarbonyl-CoA hydratase
MAHIIFEEREKTAWIRLDRPPLNIIDIPTAYELGDLLEGVEKNPDVSIVVLTSEGERAFSAGVDIRDHVPERVEEMLRAVHRVFRILNGLPQVTIAKVRGLALGGGCELAMFCDLVIAARSSVFATPEIDVGCYPPVAVAEFSARVGYHHAADLILTGRRIIAEEAWSMGLVSRVVPDEELDRETEGLLQTLRAKSPSVLRITIKALRSIARRDFESSLTISEEYYRQELLETRDIEEGVRAFLEKRRPRWTGR